MTWNQVYDPMGNMALSAALAALPVVVMLVSLAFLHIAAHWAAIMALTVAIACAVLGFGMPAQMALGAAGLGILSGLFPIGWIVLNIIFLYRLTVANGSFAYIEAARRAGARTLAELAEALTNRGVPTPAGKGIWHPEQVRRVLRLQIDAHSSPKSADPSSRTQVPR